VSSKWFKNIFEPILIGMHYLIYKITNKLNNKIYVGKHKTEHKEDEYFGSGLLLGRAIEKHGKEHFVKELLFECKTEEEMNQKESDIVDEDFIARHDTYNIKLGGSGGFDFINGNKMNNLTGRALGVRNNNELREMYSKFQTMLENQEYREEFGQKISNALKLHYLVNQGNFSNKKHSLETREKMKKAKEGKYNGKNNPAYGTMWITNGIENKKIIKNNNIPVGWKKGRV
jgi:hypothetical protein